MRSGRTPRLAAVAGGLVLGLATVTAGCSSEPPDSGLRYVAMGDSFTSAPGVEPRVDVTCGRSGANYPSLVAEELRVEDFVDVSCGGARSSDVLEAQLLPSGETVPPQIEAVTGDTDLVTIGLGGNDAGVYGALVTVCREYAGRTDAPCTDELQDRVGDEGSEALIGPTVDTLVSAIAEIRSRAPQARILLVGYPLLIEPGTACEELPLADGDYALAAAVSTGLNTALQRAARETEAEYVDVLPATEGHGICAAEPWISGVSGVAPFHPLAEGQEAVARSVARAVLRPRTPVS